LSRVTVPSVTEPAPVALKVTDCAALVEPMLGTPNERLFGETVSVGDCASAGCALTPIKAQININGAIRRTFNSNTFMAASLRRAE
jgi:hypothetical protein